MLLPKFDDDAKARWLDHLNDNEENDESDKLMLKNFGRYFLVKKLQDFFF
jgi:hypothetical protein